jgi:hypothetical protein
MSGAAIAPQVVTGIFTVASGLLGFGTSQLARWRDNVRADKDRFRDNRLATATELLAALNDFNVKATAYQTSRVNDASPVPPQDPVSLSSPDSLVAAGVALGTAWQKFRLLFSKDLADTSRNLIVDQRKLIDVTSETELAELRAALEARIEQLAENIAMFLRVPE